MNILVLNLPFPTPVIRRYSCSYYAKGFLYPPQELLRLATIIKQSHQGETFFIDAIGERKSLEEIINFIQYKKIDLVFTLLGIDFIDTDLETVKEIKARTGVPIVSISYIATLFRDAFPELDIVLDNFFEQRSFWALGHSKTTQELLENLGVALNKAFEFDPNLIAMVDRSFINPKRYQELFARGKTAFLYFGFGCPFRCNYCIRSYDFRYYVLRKKKFIFQELIELQRMGYKNIRVLDDNATLDRTFLKELNLFLKRKKLRFNFYGLSRIDLIDEELIELLREIGFKRLYLGLETLNPALQKYYNKNINVDLLSLRKKIQLLKKKGIKVGFWLLFNPMKETKEELFRMIPQLRAVRADLINLSILVPYPGTKLFNIERENISFNLRPFWVSFKHTLAKEDPQVIEKQFLFRFYLNPYSLTRLFFFALRYPHTSLKLLLNLLFFRSREVKRRDFV